MKTKTGKTGNVKEDKPQTATPTKKQNSNNHKPGAATPATDTVKNTASQSPGRNETKTNREDLLPLD